MSMMTTAVLLVFFGTMNEVPEMVTPAMRTNSVNENNSSDTGNEDNGVNEDNSSLARFFGIARFFGTMKCREHGVPEMLTPAMRTT